MIRNYDLNEEFKFDLKDIINKHPNRIVILIFGGADTSKANVIRKGYYKSLGFYKGKVIRKCNTHEALNLTPNQVVLIGMKQILEAIPKESKVLFIPMNKLGFESYFREKGPNYSFIDMVYSKSIQKEIDVKVYSVNGHAEEIENVFRKYKMIK